MTDTISEEPRDAIKAELERIEEDCIHSGKAQFNGGDRWTGYHYWVGVPSVVLSALAGTAFLSEQPTMAAAMSGAVAVLASLSTFLKPSERAAAHKSAGDQYLALRNDTRVFREIGLRVSGDLQAALDSLQALNTRRNELNQSSPPPSRADFEKAREGIRAGEAKHLVDGGKV